MGLKLEEVEFLVAMCGGDIIKAYNLCERFGGISIRIPKKSHKSFFAKKLLQKGVGIEEIMQQLKLSRSQMYRLKGEICS